MFRIATYIETGSFENEWDYALSNFSPDVLQLVDTGFQPTNNMMRNLTLHEDWSTLGPGPIVLMAPETMRNFTPTISLLDFQHPEDALYVFGPNNLHINEEVGDRVPDHVVSIPTDTNDEMFNYMAYIITAWHRRYG